MSSAERERLQAALARLGAVVGEIVATAEDRSRAVCPYKTAGHLCTFDGGCASQQRRPGEVRCAGGEFLGRGTR